MKITLEMRAGRDFDKANVKDVMIKEAIEKRVRLLLKLRREDSVKINLRGLNKK